MEPAGEILWGKIWVAIWITLDYYIDAFGLIWMTFEYVWINLYPHINPTNPVNQHRNLD
jgi:hypothetical protein